MSEIHEPRPAHVTRRAFLRAATGLGVASVAASVGSCGELQTDRSAGSGPAGTGDGAEGPRPLTRPTLREWAQEIVWLDVASAELPVAYVSMESRQVFVDRRFRDRAVGLLDAHISVSTALWRVPLPGDPPGEPITPGDALREFEERSIVDWDPSRRPSMDDVRIRRGAPASRRVELDCLPLVGRSPGAGEATPGEPTAEEGAFEGPAWCTAGPWLMEMAGEVSADITEAAEVETTREDFMLVGTGTRHAERMCSDAGEVIQLVGWAVRSR